MTFIKKTMLNAVLALTLANSAAATAATFDLKQIGTATVGSTFSVQVWANDLFSGLTPTDEFLGFGFNIDNTTPTLLSLQSFAINPNPAFSLAYSEPDPDPHVKSIVLDAGGTLFPSIENTAATQSILLGTLTFLANGIGNANFGIHTVDDGYQGLNFFETDYVAINANKNITISSISAVPVPAALPLFLSGVALFGAVRRKKTV